MRHTYQRNEHPHEGLTSNGEQTGKINTFLNLIGEGQVASVPLSDSRKELCLAFHVKGGCYEDCSHVLRQGTLNNCEIACLKIFIEKGLEKQAAANAPA
jgi:hypothetical protein